MAEIEEHLRPPATKGHVSVAKLASYWYVACRAAELRKQPIARTVLGIPLVLFRGDGGQSAALLDRCPHRNIPLSRGRVQADGTLECAYHGWRFDRGGRCRLVPGLCDAVDGGDRRAPAFATREQDGFVWVYATPDVVPDGEPMTLPGLSERGYATVVRVLDLEATLHAAVENALDVPHTAFLHRGLFRGAGEPNEITAIVRRTAGGVEAEYVGEPRPPGVAGRLLSPSGGVVSHWDRFRLPSIAQVEYRLGSENHLVVTSLCTPVSDFHTRLFAVVSFRLRLPSALVRPLIEPIALRIFRQDAEILKAQSATVRRFGGEQFMSTEIDLLGPHIWRLLKEAEGGARDAEGAGAEVERRVQLRA